MEALATAIIETPPVDSELGESIGTSREGRPIRAFQLGRGETLISLMGGAHADEPTGPWFLRRLVAWLQAQDSQHPMLSDYTWWIIPHVNPDGEARNAVWFDPLADGVDPVAYAQHVVREKPGDDMEFGFPTSVEAVDVRRENRAIYLWWQDAPGPFAMHVSLHSMSVASGPWFLIDSDWVDRSGILQHRCAIATRQLGYRLFDWDRKGDKGFTRIAPGFATRPNSQAMRQHFLAHGDHETAARFHPSSMETMRAMGGDCLTMVSEMPLFVVHSLPDQLTGEDPAWIALRDDLAAIRQRASVPEPDIEALRHELTDLRLEAMPLRDQMILQWTFIAAGLETLSEMP